MGQYLNPGNDGFQTALDSKIYVDKTGMIAYLNSLINSEQRYVCVSRPRRFGKTMAADMLTAYYGRECDSTGQFANLKIAENTEYEKYLNQYDVIHLNVQQFCGLASGYKDIVDCMECEIVKDILDEYSEYADGREKKLAAILELMYRNTKRGYIFIIDEWDCIFRIYKENVSLQKKYLDFLRDILKDRNYIKLVYMTGILPIKKYGTQSALNMFTEYSMINPGILAEYAGFTEQEVYELCQEYKADYEGMRRWYDGYEMEQAGHIYNPKSVIDAVLSGKITNYWTQSETYEALRMYIDMDYDGLRQDVITLLSGKHIDVDTAAFENDMTTFSDKHDVLTLLIHLGYLAFDVEVSEAYIPNYELREQFISTMKKGKSDEYVQLFQRSEALLAATFSQEADKVAFYIEEAHRQYTSLYTYNEENALSCVVAMAYIANSKSYYNPVREMPAGKGRADIIYVPKRKNLDTPVLVIELKWNQSAESAIAQIKEKNYPSAVREYTGNILLVGINYDDKTKKHTCKIELVEKV